MTPIATEAVRRNELSRGAMCGRLRIGKDFLHIAGLVGAAMCVRPFARLT